MSHSYCAHGIDVENYHCMKCPGNAADKLLDVLTDHVATLESAGFGSSTSTLSITTAMHAVNDHFNELRDALAAARAQQPKHGDPIGGFAEPVCYHGTVGCTTSKLCWRCREFGAQP